MASLIVLLILVGLGFPVLAIAGFFIALGQRGTIAALSHRLAAAERRIAELAALPMPAAPIPATEVETASEAEAAITPEPEIPVAAEEPVAAPPPSAWRPPSISGTAPATAPASEADFEERLGTRWTVWVGGIALALGGLFLVRYSIEMGLFGPLARLIFGLIFSAALLTAGEWMRRHDVQLSINRLPSAYIPGVLTAAGTSTAFATIYAAYALYHVLPSGLALILLGALSVATMAASALHGPALAALGLVAAFGTPLLVTSAKPNVFVVAIYIAFVSAAAYALARLRTWRWLANASAGGALFWALLFSAQSSHDLGSAMMHILIQVGLIGFFMVVEPHRDPRDAPKIDRISVGILTAFAVTGIGLATSSYQAPHPIFATLLIGMTVGLGVRYLPVAPLAATAGLVALGTIAMWPFKSAARFYTGSYPYLPAGVPEAVPAYLAFALIISLVIAGLCLWQVQRRRPPVPFAAWLCGAAAVTPIGALILTYWRVERLETSISFGIVAGLLGLGSAAATAWLSREPREDSIRLAMGSTASAALAAIAAGLTFALGGGTLSVALALTAAGAAWVSQRLELPALRYAVAAVTLLVLARVLVNPTLLSGNVGWPIFNWYLWTYGVPALAFFAASRWLAGRDDVVRFVESVSILFAALLAFFEIRHLVHGTDMLNAPFGHLEMGLYATVGLSFSILMTRLSALRPDPVYNAASLIFGGASLLISGVGLGFGFNPYFTDEVISGGAVFNSLIPAYLVPAVLAGVAALVARGVRPSWYVLWAGALALELHLLYTFLEIRRLFQGEWISLDLPTSQAELFSYSLALLLIGLAVLALGVIWNMRFARRASGAYIMAAVFKVFIIDLSHLHGIGRALSFIALGLVLIAIGIAYQRLLASKRLQNI